MQKNNVRETKKNLRCRISAIFVAIGILCFGMTLIEETREATLTGESNTGVPTDYQSVVYNDDDFRSLTILNEEDARAALESVNWSPENQDLSFSLELGECSVSKATENTYYRFQQMYQGIPVYGHDVILVADQDNKGAFIVSNYCTIEVDTVLPSISQNDALGKVFAAAGNTLTSGAFSGELVIFVEENDGAELAWRLSINALDATYFVSANNGEILACVPLYSFAVDDSKTNSALVATETSLYVSAADTAVQTQLDSGENVIIFDAGYQPISWFDHDSGIIDLVDSSGNAYVMTGSQKVDGLYILRDMQNNELYMEYTNLESIQKKITVKDANGNIITTDAWWRPRPRVDEQFVMPLSSTDTNDTSQVIHNAWRQAEQFYEEVLGCQWLDNANGIWYVAYNADVDRLGTRSYPQLGFAITELKQGDKKGASESALMHELAHPLQREIIPDYSGQWETGAIEEAICDIFAELAEDFVDGEMDNSCDWDTPYRNIKSPFATIFKNFLGYGGWLPEKYNGFCYVETNNNDTYIHHNSTVISHIAYLLSNAVDGDEAVSALSTTQIAQLFYQALHCMPADCDFYEFREVLETVAQYMLLQGQLETDRQLLCIAHAFDKANIILPVDNSEISSDNTLNNIRPLCASDVTWIIDPIYDYQQVIPLRGNRFSDMSGPYADGQTAIVGQFYEMSFPGYSNLPQYYLVQLSDGNWRLYYMPDHSDSGDIPLDDPLSGAVNRFDATGITNAAALLTEGYAPKLYSAVPCYPSPWYVFTSAARGAGGMSIYYDTYTEQALALGEFYGASFIPVKEAGLHKPYPAGRISTENAGVNVSRMIAVDAGTEQYGQLYESTLSTIEDSPKGYVNTDGQPITDFIYILAEDFSEGIAACFRDGKWGYIDETGKEITDFAYDGVWSYRGEYDPDLGDFTTEYAAYPCTSDTMVVWRDGQVGLLYRNGETLIEFGEFEDMAPAYNNELWAKLDGMWGLIDLADAKEKAGLLPVLTTPAKTKLPDPEYNPYILEQHPETEPFDYPASESQIYEFYQRISEFETTNVTTKMYTAPNGNSEVITIPKGEVVHVYGVSQNVPGWLCVEWNVIETQRQYIGNYYFDNDFVGENYFGWILTQNVDPVQSNVQSP